MNRKQKIRYLLAIYGIVLAVAIIIAVAVLLSQPPGDTRLADWKSFWLNISTELVGAVVVFIIVNILFLLDDWDLGERIAQLLNKLEQERPTADKFFHKLPELEEYIRSAQHIDMCGYTLTSAINKHLSSLQKQLASGAKIRILLVDPALKLTRDELSPTNHHLDITYSQTRIEATFKDLEYLFEKQKQLAQTGSTGTLEVRLLPQPLGVGMYGFNSYQPNGQILTELYPPYALGNPPAFTLVQKSDEVWFQYFRTQFEESWEKSTVWTHEIDSLQMSWSRPVSQVAASQFLLQAPFSYQQFMDRAQEVYLYGNSLQTTIRRNLPSLNKVLSHGGKIKILLATEGASIRENSKMLRQDALESLQWLQKNPENSGSIEVREFDQIRVFSIHIFDPDTDNGRLFVVMHIPMPTYESRPKFELLKTRDEHWFNYFLNQFNQIWEQSTPVALDASSRANPQQAANDE